DLSRIYHLAFIINTCCSGDEYLAPVSIIYIRATFKTDTILIGGIQMCWRIKEMNLFGFDSANGIRVHLYKYFGVSMASADTCAGDIVCLFRQVLGNEYFVTCLY